MTDDTPSPERSPREAFRGLIRVTFVEDADSVRSLAAGITFGAVLTGVLTNLVEQSPPLFWGIACTIVMAAYLYGVTYLFGRFL